MFEKVEKGEKSMSGLGQPQTCSHPINIHILTGVCQVVRMFSWYATKQIIAMLLAI